MAESVNRSRTVVITSSVFVGGGGVVDTGFGVFLSFLQENKFEYYYTFENTTYQNLFPTFYKSISDRELKVGGYSSINKFCGVKNLTLKYELNDFTKDTHPG